MAGVRAGVVTGIEVESPAVMAGTAGNGKFLEASPATWALVWFLLAVIVLFFVV